MLRATWKTKNLGVNATTSQPTQVYITPLLVHLADAMHVVAKESHLNDFMVILSSKFVTDQAWIEGLETSIVSFGRIREMK